MSVLAQSTDLAAATPANPAAARRDPVARVAVHSDLARIAPFWRQFQAGAVATPYQRFDWVRAFAETIGRA